MIQPAATSAHSTGRTSMRACGEHAAGGDAGQAFAALLGDEGVDDSDKPTGTGTTDDITATDRQDAADAGNASPMTPATTDASWLSLIFGGMAEIAPPVANQRNVDEAPWSPAASKGDAPRSVAAMAPAIVAAGERSVHAAPSTRAELAPAAVCPAVTESDVAMIAADVSAPVQMRDGDSGQAPDDDAVVPEAPSLTPLQSVAALQAGTLDVTVAAIRPDPATVPSDVAATPVLRSETGTSPVATIGDAPSIAAPAVSPADRALTRGSDRSSLASIPSPANLVILGNSRRPSIVTSALAIANGATSGESDRAWLAVAPSLAMPATPYRLSEASVASPAMVSLLSAAPASAAVAPSVTGSSDPAPAEQASTAMSRSLLNSVDPASESRPAAVPVGPAPSAPTSITRSNTVAPAGEVFAAAIQAVDRQQLHARHDGGDNASQQAMALAGSAPSVTGTVAATSGHGGGTLDMRHSGWPGAMVEHIERLRDAVDATDTRIRLVPDALGSIDVSLSRQGDGVSVTLAADQPATQAMLAEARPQLTELAQARGLRLAEANVGGGQGFADGQRRPAQSFVPAAPAPATSHSTDDRDPADSRVA